MMGKWENFFSERKSLNHLTTIDRGERRREEDGEGGDGGAARIGEKRRGKAAEGVGNESFLQ